MIMEKAIIWINYLDNDIYQCGNYYKCDNTIPELTWPVRTEFVVEFSMFFTGNSKFKN